MRYKTVETPAACAPHTTPSGCRWSEWCFIDVFRCACVCVCVCGKRSEIETHFQTAANTHTIQSQTNETEFININDRSQIMRRLMCFHGSFGPTFCTARNDPLLCELPT